MANWTIKCYQNPEGKRPIHSWFNSQPPVVKQAFRYALDNLRVKQDWLNPYSPFFKRLEEREDQCGDLGEIRFVTPIKEGGQDHHFRAFGYMPPSEAYTFVILHLEKKKPLKKQVKTKSRAKQSKPDRKFYMKNCHIAQDRKRRIERKEAETYERGF